MYVPAIIQFYMIFLPIAAFFWAVFLSSLRER